MTANPKKIATAPTTDGVYGKWKGYDWTEISEFLGLDLEKDDEVLAMQTRQQLNVLRSDACKARVGEALPEPSNQKITEIRHFIEKLITHQPNDTPLWQGLLAIEDDALFLEYVDLLLEHMWT